MPSPEKIQHALATLQGISPAIVLFYYLLATTISACLLQTGRKYGRKTTRRLVVGVVIFVLVTYVAQSCILIADTFSTDPGLSSVAANINGIGSTLAWLVLTFAIYGLKCPVWFPFYGSWILALVLEIPIMSLLLDTCRFSRQRDCIMIAVQVCRLVALMFLLSLLVAIQRPVVFRKDEESTALLSSAQVKQPSEDAQKVKSDGSYGSVHTSEMSAESSSNDEESDDSATKKEKERWKLIDDRLQETGNWFQYARRYTIFIPHVWPSKQPRLFLNLIGVGLCVLCERFLNVLTPRQLGIVVNALSSGSGSLYKQVAVYILLTYASSYAGIDAIKDCLWFPVQQYSYASITTSAYNHVMELSCEFHDNKQSGELYQSIRQGSSINELFELALFKLGPMFIDIAVAYWYLNFLFGPYMTLAAAATTVLYLCSTFYFNAKQSNNRRLYLDSARKESQVMYDTVGSWSTVSYYNRIPYEEDRYRSAVILEVLAQRAYFMLAYLFHALNTCIVELAFCGVLIIAAYQVSHGQKSVGDFVTLLTYWAQFTGPLYYFGSAHKTILRNLVDAEKLLQLLQTKSMVSDGLNELMYKEGAVTFENVKFSYDGKKEIIQDISFTAHPGQKIALVGETGGGKSTILKLLFRFYDVTRGSIRIDDQDIRDVTLESLRDCIGVVPQDATMFNKTVMENLRYARLGATDAEVIEACKAAQVHEKIDSFSEGYSSTVGEHGVKLSGGEKQRIAIARTLLKNPKIVLLDEATSSVDTDTESKIQCALKNLIQGRTTFVVAHRLSTVLDADIVLVIKDGMILEQGSPKALLAAKGKYHDLWRKQIGMDTLEAASAAETHSSDQSSSPGPENQSGSFGSKKIWRPDAPEFIPRHLRGNSSPEIQQDVQTNGMKEPRTQDKSTSTDDAEYHKRPHDTDDKAKTDRKPPASAVTPAIEDQAQNEAQSTTPEPIPKRARIGRFRRRNQSKSEPTGSSLSQGIGNTVGDDAGESSITPDGSGEAVATGMGHRHVSVPFGSTSTGDRKFVVQGRPRRRKYRNPKKQSSGARSTPRSSTTWSGDDATAPSPPAPTPEEVENLVNANPEPQTKAVVHFVPGT